MPTLGQGLGSELWKLSQIQSSVKRQMWAHRTRAKMDRERQSLGWPSLVPLRPDAWDRLGILVQVHGRSCLRLEGAAERWAAEEAEASESKLSEPGAGRSPAG